MKFVFKPLKENYIHKIYDKENLIQYCVIQLLLYNESTAFQLFFQMNLLFVLKGINEYITRGKTLSIPT